MEKFVAFLVELFGGKVAMQLYQEKQKRKIELQQSLLEPEKKSGEIGKWLTKIESIYQNVLGNDLYQILRGEKNVEELIKTLGDRSGQLNEEALLELIKGRIGIFDDLEVVRNFEGKFPKLQHVWVSSRKFLDSTELFETVKENILSRNVSYKYFLSWENDSIAEISNFFQRMLGEAEDETQRLRTQLMLKDNVYIYLLHPSLIDRDFFILNPLAEDKAATSRLCFTKLEFLSGFKGFGIEAKDILARRIVRLQEVVRLSQENKPNIVIVDKFSNIGSVLPESARFAVSGIETPTAILQQIPLLDILN